MRNNKLQTAFAVFSMLAVGAASAQTTGAAVDTSAVTTAISNAAAAGVVIGGAYLAMVAGVRLYKWIRGAL